MGLILILTATSLFFTYICRVIYRRVTYNLKRSSLECADPPRYPHRDSFLGLDLYLREKKAYDASRGLAFQQEFFEQHGKTVEINFFGTKIIRTMDKQNAQAILALNFKDFGLQPLREGIAEPFFGLGINTTDGKLWEHSRSLVKPTFSRAEISSFDYLERHLERFFKLLPAKPSETIDLQPLFARFFLDTSTELLFGKSADTLLPSPSPEDQEFIRSYHYVMQGFGIRVRLAWMKFLYHDPKWFAAVRSVHSWVDKYIDAAIRQQIIVESKDGSIFRNAASKNGRQYYLLQEMVKHMQSKEYLRSEILAVFMPSQDTESWLLSNIFHLLARNPRVWTKLQAEVHKLDDTTLTFECLKSMRYLQHVINEVLRFYPISDSAPRVCLNDTTLPTGGGPNRDMPVFVRKGDMVNVHMYCLHHDQEIWGEDVAEFVPERWEQIRPLWGFIPFGGGPRTCPAQQLVYTEIAYVIVRILQRFGKIENRDAQPWTEEWRIGPLSKHGCKVALLPA